MRMEKVPQDDFGELHVLAFPLRLRNQYPFERLSSALLENHSKKLLCVADETRLAFSESGLLP